MWATNTLLQQCILIKGKGRNAGDSIRISQAPKLYGSIVALPRQEKAPSLKIIEIRESYSGK